MEEEKFNNLINKMKSERMTEEEKISIHFRVMTFMENNPVSKIPVRIRSPYFSRFSFARFSKIAGTSMLLMIIGVGGLTYASAGALPGDFLYPVKVSFKEKIEEQLAFTPVKKVAFRQKKIETRYNEVETLIKQNKVTPENISVATTNINIEKEKLNNDLTEVTKTDPQIAVLAKTQIEEAIKTHQDKIITLTEQNNDIDTVIDQTLLDEQTQTTTDDQETNTDLNIINDIKLDEENYNSDLNKLDESLIQDTKNLPTTTKTLDSSSSNKINKKINTDQQSNETNVNQSSAAF